MINSIQLPVNALGIPSPFVENTTEKNTLPICAGVGVNPNNTVSGATPKKPVPTGMAVEKDGKVKLPPDVLRRQKEECKEAHAERRSHAGDDV